MTDSSFDPRDDRAYIGFAFQEIEDEILLSPEWWDRNIGAVIALIQACMHLWIIIYIRLFTSIDSTQRAFMTIIVVNFFVFHFFLCFLFFLIRKVVYRLCLYYRVIRTVEEYKKFCKSFFYILLVPVLYCFCIYIFWFISTSLVVYDKTIFQRH
jgi:hypothetical protein